MRHMQRYDREKVGLPRLAGTGPVRDGLARLRSSGGEVPDQAGCERCAGSLGHVSCGIDDTARV
jgi:hypothetical protein